MPRRILEGRVVSDKMDKTVTVLVERRYMHPMYKKYVKRTDKYAAHDETNAVKEGDFISIQECRPISKRKTWTVITGAEGQSATPKKVAIKKKEDVKAPAQEVEAKVTPPKETAKKQPPKKTEDKKSK